MKLRRVTLEHRPAAKRDAWCPPALAGHARRAFTLVEILIVVGLVAMVMAIGIPAMVEGMKKSPMRQAVSDVLEACKEARAQAILQGVPAELVFSGKDGRISVRMMQNPGPAVSAAGAPHEPSPPVKMFSAQLMEEIGVEEIGVNFQSQMEAEEARVRFYPNGTSDEFTIVLRSLQQDIRKISLDVATGLANLEVIK